MLDCPTSGWKITQVAQRAIGYFIWHHKLRSRTEVVESGCGSRRMDPLELKQGLKERTAPRLLSHQIIEHPVGYFGTPIDCCPSHVKQSDARRNVNECFLKFEVLMRLLEMLHSIFGEVQLGMHIRFDHSFQ